MLWRHAQLTGDSIWLEKSWNFIEREVKNIQRYRANSYQDGNPLTDGLMPMGNADGGIGGIYAEYTNNYWVLSGLAFAIQAAKSLGKTDQAEAWQQFFNDYYLMFDKARRRDLKVDALGNAYVPTFMGHHTLNPTTGQWAFMHSIYPGQLYEEDDSLMQATLHMLDQHLEEGLIYGTGWLPKGLWTYSASFHGHAHLWNGNGYKVPQILYDFANHASPLLCWSEEQHPVDFKGAYLMHGDMPHNWASVEFIRLIRHALVLEKNNELHLFAGMPSRWVASGKAVEVKQVATIFGEVSLRLEVNEKDAIAHLNLEVSPHKQNSPDKIIIHQTAFGKDGIQEFPYKPALQIELNLETKQK